MRKTRIFLAAALALAFSTPLLAQANSPANPPASNQPVTTLDQAIDHIVSREHDMVEKLTEYSPIVETYIQKIRRDTDLGSVPIDDSYFIGKLRLKDGVEEQLFTTKEGTTKSVAHKMLGPFAHIASPEFLPNGFANMIFPDQDSFDRQHYEFSFVQREFLGDLRTLVWDVAPKKGSGNGRFQGRIWVEDKDFTIVRVNGTYVPRPKHGMYFHFDAWRVNVAPDLWVPAYVYSEESDALYGLAHHLAFKAQTRLWGYQSKGSGHQSEFSEILVDSQSAKDQSSATQDASPLESQRAFVQQAEINVLERLQRAGLLAPPGDVDKVLQTVVNNLEITNKLDIIPEVHCRVLLTTPLETFAVGHTIVVSRGLIDVLPDEASLAAVLARELAHITLGHRFDTKFAFSDRMIFEDHHTYQKFAFGHTPEEEAAADHKALEFLKNSPYAEKLATAGLFLKALDSRAMMLPNLNRPHLGSSLVDNGRVAHLTELITGAPQYEPTKVDQIAALPLGGRVKMSPWDNKVELVKAAPMPLLSAADKMPFEVAPFLPHLKRLSTTDGEVASNAASK